jgi:hypothetical protein
MSEIPKDYLAEMERAQHKLYVEFMHKVWRDLKADFVNLKAKIEGTPHNTEECEGPLLCWGECWDEKKS